jgi:hypothetical protein
MRTKFAIKLLRHQPGHLTESQCIQHLAKLEQLRLIELLPKNRIKVLVAYNFNWQGYHPSGQNMQRSRGRSQIGTGHQNIAHQADLAKLNFLSKS